MAELSIPEAIMMIRDQLDDESPGDQYGDKELLRYINQAVGYYDVFLANHMKRMNLTSKDITGDGSTEFHRIAPYLPRIVSVENVTNSPRTEIVPIQDGFRDRFNHLGTSLDPQITGAYNQYYLRNNGIGILPIAESGTTNRVWMILRTPPLHYGLAQASQSAADTSITLSVTPNATYELGDYVKMNDAYNEINIMLTVDDPSATDTAADPIIDLREINTITDHVGSTGVCTVAWGWENAITSGTTQYSLLPRLDPACHMLLVYQAIILGNLRTDEPTRDIIAERDRLEAQLLLNIRRESIQRNRRVSRTGWNE